MIMGLIKWYKMQHIGEHELQLHELVLVMAEARLCLLQC